MAVGCDNFEQILKGVLLPYYFGDKQRIDGALLYSPHDIVQIVMATCPKPQYFKINSNTDKDTAVQRHQPLSLGRIAKRLLGATFNRPSECYIDSSSRIGSRYQISDFPMFSLHTPKNGIPLGKGQGFYWIRPTDVVITGNCTANFTKGFEIRFTFKMCFEDGTCGDAGYIDRIDKNGKLSRIHVYPDGKTESADTYTEHRKNHDVYRTLIGQILVGEIYPELYQVATSQLKNINPDTLFRRNRNAPASKSLQLPSNIIPLFESKMALKAKMDSMGNAENKAQHGEQQPKIKHNSKLTHLKDFKRVI